MACCHIDSYSLLVLDFGHTAQYKQLPGQNDKHGNSHLNSNQNFMAVRQPTHTQCLAVATTIPQCQEMLGCKE
jgi:hypothetical protein